MSNTNLTVAQKALDLVAEPVLARQNVIWLGMTAIALLSTPEHIRGWVVFWLIVAALFATLTLTNIYQARRLEDPRQCLIHLGITYATSAVAILISIAIRPISGFVLLMVLALLTNISEHRPFVTTAISVIAVPWWIWLAADSWKWQLVVLVPFISIGLMAVSHILDTHAWPSGTDRILPARAHRFAAWMLIAISGLILILLGILGDVSKPWLALAGIILAASIPLEAGIGIDSGGSAKSGVRIITSAYLIATCCWLIGIE